MDFKQCLEKLEAAGRLVRVRSEVDLVHELAGVARKFEGKQAVIFDKIRGHRMPLAMGLWWNRDNLAHLFDVSAAELPGLFARAVKSLRGAPVPPIAHAGCSE